MQKEIENRNHILETMMDYVQDALYVIDTNGEEIFCKNIERFVPEDRKRMLGELMSVFETGQGMVGKYRKYLTKDQRKIHMLSTAIPVKKDNEIIAGILVNSYINRMQKVISKAVDLQNQVLLNRNNSKLPNNGTRYTFENIIGESKQIQAVIRNARKASTSNAPILLYGETGTGKEIVAQSIHNNSKNREEAFVGINCAAIPETLLESLLFGTTKGIFTGSDNNKGLLEQAGRGTLFLDEINSMNTDLQAKFLRVLQEKRVRRLGGNKEVPIHCRIICATNTDPKESIKKKELREDFFYRIAVIVIHLPPLRERKDDILILADYFLKKFSSIYGKLVTGLSVELKNIFLNYTWPGNVRELSHIVEGAFNLIDNETILTVDSIPDYFQCNSSFRSSDDLINQDILQYKKEFSLPDQLREIEKRIILDALKKNNQNITKTALSLGIHRQNLQARMKKLKVRKQYI